MHGATALHGELMYESITVRGSGTVLLLYVASRPLLMPVMRIVHLNKGLATFKANVIHHV